MGFNADLTSALCTGLRCWQFPDWIRHTYLLDYSLFTSLHRKQFPHILSWAAIHAWTYHLPTRRTRTRHSNIPTIDSHSFGNRAWKTFFNFHYMPHQSKKTLFKISAQLCILQKLTVFQIQYRFSKGWNIRGLFGPKDKLSPGLV